MEKGWTSTNSTGTHGHTRKKTKKKKKNLDHVLHPSNKINSKWIIDLHIKGKAIKLRKLTCRKI